MPPRELSDEAFDADNPRAVVLTEAASDPAPTSTTHHDDLAAIEARAESARARATALREQAEAAAAGETRADQAVRAPRSRRRLPQLGRKGRAVVAALLISCAALAGSGYLVWDHHQAEQQRQRAKEFAAAARNAVLTMMSIDGNRARDDMQRFADETTGQFKAGVLMGAEDMVKALEQSKITAKATIQAVGVQSMTENSAVVLVAAKSELTKPDKDKPEIRMWRLVVNVERDGGRLKVAKVEFVP
ncbi:MULTISPECIES: hypothetical protein [Mycobacterium]|uniref:Mce protein n=1 Tax=Mycobacterium kiyosense TaxID=2871094 RepID=A0A9P3V0F2_9MYCO|nr:MULTISPECIES: hypothetical protein [Mycobacterium]BDB44943.1 hypothetical protein IWGMT90018_53890 [Mycobacterium kiyosense]BDE16431.1 hypothetical protein MKCMC460_52910 [Mycobacterium sp. 20KCMC460]GLB83314.1 hypothetical protein SRL2020028_25700 [Mycobacterium kiyosense]GLB89646.1 hypothetical protein SRL2020130_24630 [Mycobacterium kiyosense]GLB96791.1 hypothetical protein SRL2020226_35670 [Mycobacterium kiyosense]